MGGLSPEQSGVLPSSSPSGEETVRVSLLLRFGQGLIICIAVRLQRKLIEHCIVGKNRIEVREAQVAALVVRRCSGRVL